MVCTWDTTVQQQNIYTYYVFIRCCKRLHHEFLATFLWKSMGVGCPPFRKLRHWQQSIICAGHVDVPMTPATLQVSETTTQIQLEERSKDGNYLENSHATNFNIFNIHKMYTVPIGSMYGIYANIWGILMVNVTIYSIHGSYGVYIYIQM